MNNLPSPENLDAASGAAHRVLRERIVRWWHAAIAGSANFVELYERGERAAAEMRRAGYRVTLLDENSEHFIIYLVHGLRSSITVHITLDEETGRQGVGCVFVDLGSKTSMAADGSGDVVERKTSGE